MVELPWADELDPEVLKDLCRAREENDPWDIYDVLAYYLGIVSPNEMIHDGANDMYVDFPASWLDETIWKYWKDGNPGWSKQIKTALIAGIIFSPTFVPSNGYFEDWKKIVEQLQFSDPVVSPTDIDEYHRLHPTFVLSRLA